MLVPQIPKGTFGYREHKANFSSKFKNNASLGMKKYSLMQSIPYRDEKKKILAIITSGLYCFVFTALKIKKSFVQQPSKIKFKSFYSPVKFKNNKLG